MSTEEVIKELEHTIKYFGDSTDKFHMGRKYQAIATLKQLRQPPVISSVCNCIKFRETPMINGKHICSICNKPIVQTDL